jgi:hypothetical protein
VRWCGIYLCTCLCKCTNAHIHIRLLHVCPRVHIVFNITKSQSLVLKDSIRKYTIRIHIQVITDSEDTTELGHNPDDPDIQPTYINTHTHAGDYRFEDTIELGDHPEGVHPSHKYVRLRTLNVTSTNGARTWGRMIFGKWARGWFSRTMLMLTTLNSYKAIVEVRMHVWI